MSAENDKKNGGNIVLHDQMWLGIRRILYFIALCVCVQTCLVLYLIFGQAERKFDAQFVTVTESMLDLQARIAQVEQENTTLFRMLRYENDQHGVILDRTSYPVNPVPPRPPQPVKRIGDAAPGESMGESMGDTPKN